MGFATEDLKQYMVAGTTTGTDRYVNSGVLPTKQFDFPGGNVVVGGKGVHEILLARPGVQISQLILEADSVHAPYHTHLAAEVAVVNDGAYHDADLEGNVVQLYPTGTVVGYAPWSTHRPHSTDGAKITYVAFGGLIEAKDVEPHLRKILEMGCPVNAFEWAMLSLVPDRAERHSLLDRIFQ